MSITHASMTNRPEAKSEPSNPDVVVTKGSRLGAYIALTKPRIIELLLVTTVPTMVVAARGWPSLGLMAATVLGGTLAAGGANAINMVLDRDIDAVMHRTRKRPIVRGSVGPREALVFAISLEIAAFVLLITTVNLLSAVLALSAAAFYVFIYTMLLKRNSPSNIVIGGAAGAVPVLIGWSAVTNQIELAPFVLFVLVFLWTPPHFWALAIKYKDDYASASVPMLPVVASMETTTLRIFLYAVSVAVCSIAFYEVAQLGLLFLVVAVSTGLIFAGMSWQLHRRPSVALAMKVFHYSITYLTVIFCAMALDRLLLLGPSR